VSRQGPEHVGPRFGPRGSLARERDHPCQSRSKTTSCAWRSGRIILATARKRADGWWEVSYWRRFFGRNQAITALTITEHLNSGRDSNDPVIRALRKELR
jgi:hypothetical protein